MPHCFVIFDEENAQPPGHVQLFDQVWCATAGASTREMLGHVSGGAC